MAGRRPSVLHQHRGQIRHAGAERAEKGGGTGYSVPLPPPRSHLAENIGWFLEKYKRWSTYTPEAWTAAIFCGSIYGHTENACEILASRLAEKGVRHVRIFDVSHTDVSEQVSAAFQCSHLVFASATYNGGIYTPMETLLLELKAHALQNRTVALIENGSWGPAAARLMAKHLEEMKGMEQIAPPITIRSAVKEEQYRKLEDLADLIAADIAAEE